MSQQQPGPERPEHAHQPCAACLWDANERGALRGRIATLHGHIAKLEGLPVPGHPDHGRCSGCPQREDGWR